MKKIVILAASLITTLVVLAQSTIPIAIDWRYSLRWTDPNGAGDVTSWIVTATNSPTNVRTTATRTTSIDLLTLLNGAPRGSYYLYTVAISSLGDTSEPGDTIIVIWPGGNGKIHGGAKLNANK